MTDHQHITDSRLFKEVAGTFAEALLLPDDNFRGSSNVFGREITVRTHGGLSYLLGTAAAGMRSAGMIDADQLLPQMEVLASFRRLHIPLTLAVYNNGPMYLPQLIQAGCVVFNASGAVEFCDLILMAQVISEKTLVPVVVLFNAEDIAGHDYQLPDPNKLARWFGDPDDRVNAPGTAQEIVFGPVRRRMPVWMHIDQPMLTGAKKNAQMKGLEIASYAVFDNAPVQFAINETFEAFTSLTGRQQLTFELIGRKRYKHLIITTAIEKSAKHDKQLLYSLDKLYTALVVLRQIHPLYPGENIVRPELKDVLVLESVSDSAEQGPVYASICKSGKYSQIYKENGWFAQTPGAQAIEAALDYLLDTTTGNGGFWLDIPLTLEKSAYPKHEILFQRIRRDFPHLARIDVRSESNQDKIPATGNGISPVVKKFAGLGPPYAQIGRFYDDTACLYENAPSELFADPFQAYPVMPAGSAALVNREKEREYMPVFHPELYKDEDIDSLILSCPSGALPSTFITIEALIDSGIRQSGVKGRAIAQLIPLKKKWVQEATLTASEMTGKARTVSDILEPAFEKVLTLAKVDEEKTEILKNEKAMVLGEIGAIQVVVSNRHFNEQEIREKGSGELFTLAVDPFACTGCGHCARLREQGCMTMESQEAVLEDARTAFNRFEVLPETPTYTIERLIETDQFDPFAALLLNKTNYRSFFSSYREASDSGEDVTGHLSALIAHRFKPLVAQKQKMLELLIEKLKNNTINQLSKSLPVDHLDSLMEVLNRHHENRLDMVEVFEEWGRENEFNAPAKADLERKLHLLKALETLNNHLQSGISGDGRPAYTVVLDKSASRMARYPYNPFTVPAIYTGQGDTAAVALGICTGQIRHILDEVRLLRRAELEASGKYNSGKHDAELAALTWDNLTKDERQFVPPMLVIANKNWLSTCDSSQVMALLGSEYPVKIYLLDDGIQSPDQLQSSLQMAFHQQWPLVAQGKTFIGNGTISDRKYLYQLMSRSLSYPGTSLLTVLAPDPAVFHISPSQQLNLSALAVSTRAFLRWYYDPEIASDSVGGRIQTEIQDIDSDFPTVPMEYVSDGEYKVMDYTLTWADWAYWQPALKPFFAKLDNGENTLSIKEYLKLSKVDRAGKTPVILRINDEAHLVYYAVAPFIAEAAEVAIANVKLLREWAGLYTGYPEKLKAVVHEELKKTYESERSRFEEELKREKADWEASYLRELKTRMKDTLLNLSGM